MTAQPLITLANSLHLWIIKMSVKMTEHIGPNANPNLILTTPTLSLSLSLTLTISLTRSRPERARAANYGRWWSRVVSGDFSQTDVCLEYGTGEGAHMKMYRGRPAIARGRYS